MTDRVSFFLRRVRIMMWIWTLVLVLVVYLTTWQLDRLPGGDSGELLAEACVGGVAHPPGYPLLLTLLRIVRWTTLWCCGEGVHFVMVANAVNALLAALAAACVTHIVQLLDRSSDVEALAAGLMFALSKLTWEYARGVEVFALNNFLVGLLHILVVRHSVKPTTRNACLGAFVCGLGLANQHTIVLFEVPFIVWVLLTRRFRATELLWLAISFLAGLSIYLQTILSAQEPTPGSWGDTSTLSGFLTHVRRKEYGTFQLSPMAGASEGLLARLEIYALDFVDDFHWTGLAFACFGIKYLLCTSTGNDKGEKENRPFVGYAQMSALVCYLLVFHSLANLPLDAPMPRAVSSRFNMQPNSVLAIWLGLGLAATIRVIVSRITTHTQWTHVIRWSICMALVSAQFQRSYRGLNSTTHEDLIRAHGDAIFSVMPRNSVLLSYTDITWNSVRYLQTCEGVRSDVTHLSLQLLPFPWFPRQHALYPTVKFPLIHRDASTVKGSPGYERLLHDFLAANAAKHSNHLFLDLHAVNDDDIAPNGQYLGFTLTPHGLIWKVNLPTANVDTLYSQWKSLPSPEVHFAVAVYPPGSWEFAAATIANDARYQGGLFALSYWLERGRKARPAGEAAKYVIGMHHALQLLIQVDAAAAITNGNWGLTYESYDMAKNTALAAMRLTTGLDLIAPLLSPLKKESRRNGASHHTLTEINELQELVQQTNEIRLMTHRRIEALVPAMKARQDRDARAFEDFAAASSLRSKKMKMKSGSKKKTRKRPKGKHTASEH